LEKIARKGIEMKRSGRERTNSEALANLAMSDGSGGNSMKHLWPGGLTGGQTRRYVCVGYCVSVCLKVSVGKWLKEKRKKIMQIGYYFHKFNQITVAVTVDCSHT